MDWTKECDHALFSLKESLLQSVVLAHPDFTRPLILAINASLDVWELYYLKYQQAKNELVLSHSRAKP